MKSDFYILLLISILISQSSISEPIIRRHDIQDKNYVMLAFEYFETEALFLLNKIDVAGTLVSPHFLLSAAHIANDIEVGDSLISKHQKYQISRIIFHLSTI